MTGASAKALSAERRHEVFAALVGNGLDFFVRSAEELATAQKFSVVNFATGVELLLKARLFHEHWTLVAVKPHQCSWSSFVNGDVRTIQASDLCEALSSATGAILDKETTTAFDAVFRHRNRIVHFIPQDNVAAIVAQQCRAWHDLRALLIGPWRAIFLAFHTRIDQVERLLRAHRTYLDVKFQQLEQLLKESESSGLLLICPACSFRAGVADESPGKVHFYNCQVCEYEGTALRSDSGILEHKERAEMLDVLDPTPILRPKEMATYEPDRGYCGECFEFPETVAMDGTDYVCVACAVRFNPSSSSACQWCNSRWFGWDTEGSYYSGCEHCEGHGIGRD